MARKFLYFVAVCIVVVIVGAIALTIWSREATEIAFVPRGEFVEQEPLAANAYQDPAMWYSRPGLGTSDPARYQPAIAETAPRSGRTRALARSPGRRTQPRCCRSAGDHLFARGRSGSEPGASELRRVLRSADELHQGSAGRLECGTQRCRDRPARRGIPSRPGQPFQSRADELWAPKYRQAAVGAFLTDKPEATLAIDAAYADVAQAFDYFVSSIGPDKPIVLAGHSQGSTHVLRLLRDKVAGTPLEPRIAAVYAPGWPISVEHDLPALPLPACATANQPACLIAYASFADDGDPGQLLRRYSMINGLDGEPRGEDDPIVCVNPLTGRVGGSANADANLGTLVPSDNLATAELIAGAVPARCDEQGLLRIGDPPELGEGVLPGGNYHVYDIPLFWKNLQEDVVARVKAWTSAQAS